MPMPQVNRWYTGFAGRMFRVKSYAMDARGVSEVLLEYPDGRTQLINRHEWFCLSEIQERRPSA